MSLTYPLDLQFYRQSYPDLAMLNASELKAHWHTCGYQEHRCPNLAALTHAIPGNFDVDLYRHHIPSLRYANDQQVQLHFYQYGPQGHRVFFTHPPKQYKRERKCRKSGIKEDVFSERNHMSNVEKTPSHNKRNFLEFFKVKEKHDKKKTSGSLSDISLEDIEKTLPPDWTPLGYRNCNPDLGLTTIYDLKKHWWEHGRHEQRPYISNDDDCCSCDTETLSNNETSQWVPLKRSILQAINGSDHKNNIIYIDLDHASTEEK